jgi:hypothetical protein
LIRSIGISYHQPQSVSFIPPTVSFIAADAFDLETQLSLANCDSCPDLQGWCLDRVFYPAKDFRRRLRLGVELPALSDCLLNLSHFECDVDGNSSSVIDRRRSDSLEIVMKSIETLLSLRHPCIAVPLGFVLSENGNKMTMVNRYAQSDSLAVVIAQRPPWWTATAKAIAVAGLLIGLNFLHSFGRPQGRLKPTDLLFDDKHRIQIVDIGCDDQTDRATAFMAPEVIEGGEFTAASDVFSFAMITLSIITERTAWPLGRAPIVPGSLPEWIADLIIRALSTDPSHRPLIPHFLQLLRHNEFAIFDGVDSAAVLDFVNLVESVELSWPEFAPG